MLWVLLIGGSVISIGFTTLFGTGNKRVHVGIVVMLSALLGFVLFLIFSLEHPFSGTVAVKPAPYQHVLDLWTARAK